MKTKITLLLVFSVIMSLCEAQNSLKLTFTALNNQNHIQLDSIKVLNRTQGGDTLITDSMLILYWVGIADHNAISEGFEVRQNYPNPVKGTSTTIQMAVPEDDMVRIVITDQKGSIIHELSADFCKGSHRFLFKPGASRLYFFTTYYRSSNSSIKIINMNISNKYQCALEYTGFENISTQLKSTTGSGGFPFCPGDTLLYVGYSDGLESGNFDNPIANTTYTIQFATNIPCPGIPTVTYGGHVYNTIQVFDQCWLKENLNVGVMIPQTQNQSHNGIIEKHCYEDSEDSCAIYGGLYQWSEMMQYSNEPGIQGICPEGWHLPTDLEWMILEGAVDSQYGIGDSIWDQDVHRGYDAGSNLKTTNGWYNNGNGTDLFGYALKPSGYRAYTVAMVYKFSYIWTSTWLLSSFGPVHRDVNFAKLTVFKGSNYGSGAGMSVRCIKDK